MTKWENMAKTISLFDRSGNDASSPKNLDVARDIISRVSQDGRCDFIALLLKAIKEHPDIAAAFAWLYVHERRHDDDDDAYSLLAELLDNPVFSQTQRQRSVKVVTELLDKSLRDNSLPDDIKIHIIPLLAMVDQPIDDDAVSRHFQNYDEAMDRQSEKFIKNLSDSPSSLMDLLIAKHIVPQEEDSPCPPVSVEAASELLSIGQRVAEVNPAGATIMTAALIFRAEAPDFSYEKAPGQLNDIHALATPRARWCLETLANWPGFAMPIRDKAARLAAELAKRSIKNEAPPAPGAFSHGSVSIVDGMGSRAAVLFHNAPRNNIEVINVILNDEVGVTDVFADFDDGNKFERMLPDNPHKKSFAAASLSLLRELLADSFALHEELGTAPPANLFPLLPYFGDEPIKPRKREPDLSAYNLTTMRPTPKRINNGIELVHSTAFSCLAPASDAAYIFCQAHLDKRKKSLRDRDFSAFLQKIMPMERDRLLQRMAVNLEFEALAGRAQSKKNRTAARLWLAMKEEDVPFWTIPFVQELARAGIETIAEHLKRGFKNKREAFAAEQKSIQEMDALFSGMLEQLFGDGELADLPPQAFWSRTSKHYARPDQNAQSRNNAGKSPTGKTRKIYRLAVEIINYPPHSYDFMEKNPGILREIEIAGDQSLDQLHATIFKAFDREEMHPYEFRLSSRRNDRKAPRFVDPLVLEEGLDCGLEYNAEAATLDELGLRRGQTFLYWFDFGDDWWHKIKVLKIGSPEPGRKYPRIAARHGASPPQYRDDYPQDWTTIR